MHLERFSQSFMTYSLVNHLLLAGVPACASQLPSHHSCHTHTRLMQYCFNSSTPCAARPGGCASGSGSPGFSLLLVSGTACVMVTAVLNYCLTCDPGLIERSPRSMRASTRVWMRVRWPTTGTCQGRSEPSNPRAHRGASVMFPIHH